MPIQNNCISHIEKKIQMHFLMQSRSSKIGVIPLPPPLKTPLPPSNIFLFSFPGSKIYFFLFLSLHLVQKAGGCQLEMRWSKKCIAINTPSNAAGRVLVCPISSSVCREERGNSNCPPPFSGLPKIITSGIRFICVIKENLLTDCNF